MQDEILTDLAKIADLKVISRTSVMQYKTGAAAQPARNRTSSLASRTWSKAACNGSANQVRVNAQLINARNDAHLWAQTYDRDLADVFAIQSEIAKAIADQLQAKLSPAEKNAIEQRPTTDVAAFELYSRANDLILNTRLQRDQARESAVQESICSIRPWHAIPPSSRRSVSSHYAHDIVVRLARSYSRQRAWQKPPSRQHSSCALMPEKRISPARIIFTPPIVITTARWPSSTLSAAKCPMLLGSSS